MAKAIGAGRTPQPAIYRLLTPHQINRMANRQAAASLAASEAPIMQQQQYADARAAAARQAMQAAGAAASGLLGNVGTENENAYDQATRETKDLVSGLSGQLGQQMQADQAAGDAFRQQQAPGSSSQEQVNPQDAQNAAYDTGAVIPGSNLAEQGAAAASYGNELPATMQAQSLQDQAASYGQQATDDHTYVNQLLTLAAQQPATRQAILKDLYATEAQKADAITRQQAENLSAQSLGLTAQKTGAEIAREKALTKQGQARIRQGNIRLNLEGQSLVLRQQSQKLAIQKAQRQGRQVDMNTSKARGYYVDNSGNPILTKNGKQIPFAGTASSSTSKGSSGSSGVTTTQLREAQQYAQKNFARANNSPIDPSNPLAPIVPFRKAQDYLTTYYGLSKKQARSILVQLGRKPDGKRK